MTEDHQITALREEIRLAGRRTWLVRCQVVGAGALLGVSAFLLVEASHMHIRSGGMVELWLNILVGGSLLLLPSGYLIALLLREESRRHLRDRLDRLLAHERVQVLQPLVGSHRDEGKLAAALLHELGIPTEMAPSITPEIRGDEASPAEKSR